MSIETTYREVGISYIERNDHWAFEVNNRVRTAESLKAAKDAIDRSLDRPEPADKFEPINAIYISREYDFEPMIKCGRITSVVNKRSFGSGKYVRFSCDGSAKEESSIYLHLDTPETRAVIESINALSAQMVALREKRTELFSSIPNVEIA